MFPANVSRCPAFRWFSGREEVEDFCSKSQDRQSSPGSGWRRWGIRVKSSDQILGKHHFTVLVSYVLYSKRNDGFHKELSWIFVWTLCDWSRTEAFASAADETIDGEELPCCARTRRRPGKRRTGAGWRASSRRGFGSWPLGWRMGRLVGRKRSKGGKWRIKFLIMKVFSQWIDVDGLQSIFEMLYLPPFLVNQPY